jgi:hypothetical protein
VAPGMPFSDQTPLTASNSLSASTRVSILTRSSFKVSLVLLMIFSIKPANDRVRPNWLNALAATVNLLTGCCQIRHFVMAVTKFSVSGVLDAPFANARTSGRH